MLFQKRQNDNEGVFISTVGSHFTLLKAAPVTRVSLFKNGSKVFESIMWQGMSLKNIPFDNIYISSDVIQDITIWAGQQPIDVQEPSIRQQTIRADQVFISNGINTLLENDPARVIARVECDKDIWIGGENMAVVLGTPQNARRYKAGQEFEIRAYGHVNCYISDTAQAVLFDNDGSVSNVAVPWEYGTVRTRTELENLGVPYFDIEIPARMAGVPFKLKVLLQFDEGVTAHGSKLFITQGDPTTEALDNTGFVSGGVSPGTYEYEGNQHLKWPNGLSVGVHRVFMVDETTSAGYTAGQTVGTRFLKVWTENNVFALAGTCQVMQERG
ncbi:hypothetical protein [Pseudoalteromonas sp. B160]|uniref:hypothetical protein n=1 Tax=Pseudoalteromonas sp. B160 TaxID=630414 RepID=UPI00301E133B